MIEKDGKKISFSCSIYQHTICGGSYNTNEKRGKCECNCHKPKKFWNWKPRSGKKTFNRLVKEKQ